VQFYHRTPRSNAVHILSEGFKDGEGFYGCEVTEPLCGVWLSQYPLTEDDGARGDMIFEVILNRAESELADFEIINEGATYREWCVPAAIVNAGKLRLVSSEEESGLPTFIEEFWRARGGVPAEQRPVV
jgi:hypothetical protein